MTHVKTTAPVVAPTVRRSAQPTFEQLGRTAHAKHPYTLLGRTAVDRFADELMSTSLRAFTARAVATSRDARASGRYVSMDAPTRLDAASVAALVRHLLAPPLRLALEFAAHPTTAAALVEEMAGSSAGPVQASPRPFFEPVLGSEIFRDYEAALAADPAYVAARAAKDPAAQRAAKEKHRWLIPDTGLPIGNRDQRAWYESREHHRPQPPPPARFTKSVGSEAAHRLAGSAAAVVALRARDPASFDAAIDHLLSDPTRFFAGLQSQADATTWSVQSALGTYGPGGLNSRTVFDALLLLNTDAKGPASTMQHEVDQHLRDLLFVMAASADKDSGTGRWHSGSDDDRGRAAHAIGAPQEAGVLGGGGRVAGTAIGGLGARLLATGANLPRT